ncbi:N-acetylmuramoyl-L-alanine amidase [Cytobacillus spongiae]|jgi:N-acetylmuramoyl-L-alanine amidase|uniref:N-acetylmuramoyl-L-alanine amidase n=1 Tax=Cytobacillus spongiae TaxID=2901381 RepID=UPI001F4500CE|nr:N-acetylmuramoyl-L-alanine amidase [Cytobacillus spongiae]UII55576.1 N-acetylmuramoyl-L-alanine amidase [Cytobacillus spongiae]
MKMMIDAGHGYNTPGKRSPDGLREYEFNRAVANYVKLFLENYQNVTVYFAHSDQRDVPLTERTDRANALKVDCFVSIHANAYGSGWNSADGIETYVYTTKPREAYELALKIQKYIIASTGRDNRGVKTADFHVLRETNMTAVLVECGFMTNQEEAKLLRSDAYRRTCADAIVKALAEQYKLVKKPVSSSTDTNKGSNKTPSTGKGLFKVQVGAFSDKKNAEELAAQLKKDGYAPYIYQE